MNRRILLFTIVAAVASVGIPMANRVGIAGQTQSPQATRLEFEVTVVRPLAPGVPNPSARFACRGVDGAVSPEGVVPADAVPQGRCVGDTSLTQLIAVAYGTQRRYVSGGPVWMQQPAFQLYRIDAQAADLSKTTTEQLRQMLQSLLVDRFQLAFHRVMQQSQEHVLRVARDGPKLKPASGTEEPPRLVPSGVGLANITIRGKSELGKLANFLSSFVGYPVVDNTAITGMHEYSLRLTMVPGQRGGGAGLRGVGGGGGGGGEISITEFDPPVSIALQEQLGLRLDPENTKVEMIVIDRVERPSEN